MKPRTRNVIAALAAASAATFALAQTPAELDAFRQATVEEKPVLSDQTMVSVATGARGPNVEMANTIVQQIIADPSMKSSKITVTPEENRILLTGVTPTLEQKLRVRQIATQHAGEGNVSDGIITEEAWLVSAETGLPAGQAGGQGTATGQGTAASSPAAAGVTPPA